MATQETTQKLLDTATKARDLLMQKKNQMYGTAGPTPMVAGATTSAPPAARGDDFAGDFETSGGAQTARETGGSIGGVIDFQSGLLSYDDLVSAGARSKSLTQSALNSGTSSGRLGSDALRTANLNTALSESTSAAGARSSQPDGGNYTAEDVVRGNVSLLSKDNDGTFTLDETGRAQALDLARKRLAEISAQAEKLKKQEVDSSFDGISTDDAIVNQEQAAIERLNEPETFFANSMAMIESLERSIQDQLDAEIDAAQANYQSDRASLEDRQAREAGQLSTGLAQAGGYLGFTGSGTGVMLSLTKSHRAELQELKTIRDKAVAEARQAAAEKRYDVVRENARIVQEIESLAYEQTLNYQKEMKSAADKQAEQAKQQQTQTDIFNAIQSGNKTPEDIFRALGGKTDIAEITGFLEDLSDSGTPGAFKFSASETTKLIGAGLSADDVTALHEYVNENGYNDEVRNLLSPSARAVADKIFREKTGSGGGGTTTSETAFVLPDGTKISNRTMQVLDGFTRLDALTPTAQAEVRDELYEMGFGSDKPADWFDETFVADMYGTPLTQDMIEKYYRLNIEPTVLDEELARLKKQFINEAWGEYRDTIFGRGESSATNGGDKLSFDDF